MPVDFTVAGREQNDWRRAVISPSGSPGIDGDGLLDDSSFGIWEGTTNQITNGGGETNVTGWSLDGSGTITSDSAAAKFGARSLKLVGNGSNGNAPYIYVNSPAIAAAAGQTFTVSCWVRRDAAGAQFQLLIQWRNSAQVQISQAASGAIGSAVVGDFIRLSFTATAPVSTAYAVPIFQALNSPNGVAVYWDGLQLEQKPVATPYVHTDGATAARSDSRVQGPSSQLGGVTQGWIAMRVRPRWPGGSGQAARFFSWRAANDGIEVYYKATPHQLALGNVSGGTVTAEATADVSSWAAGQAHTVVAYWTGTTLGISVDGGAFATIARGTLPNSANLTAQTLFDVGRYAQSAVEWLNGEVLWLAAGSGVPTATDVARLNWYGDADPLQPGALGASPTLIWPAADVTAWTPGALMQQGRDSAATAFAIPANESRVNRLLLPVRAVVRRALIYLDGLGGGAGSQSFQAVIYADDGTKYHPGTLLATSATVSVAASYAGGWLSFNFAPQAVLDPGLYWIGYISGGTASVARFYYDANTANTQQAMFNGVTTDTFADGPASPYPAFTATGNGALAQLLVYEPALADFGVTVSETLARPAVGRAPADTGAAVADGATAATARGLSDTGNSFAGLLERTRVTRAPADTGAAVSSGLLLDTPRLYRLLEDEGAAISDPLRRSGLARSAADSYADGAAASFGPEAVEFPDYAMWVDSFPAYAPPPREFENYYARLPFPEAQRKLGEGGPTGQQAASCTWHGTLASAERGSFILVRAGSEWEDLIGTRVRLSTRGGRPRRVVGFVYGVADLDERDDFSVTRRLYMGLALPGTDRVAVVVEPLQRT